MPDYGNRAFLFCFWGFWWAATAFFIAAAINHLELTVCGLDSRPDSRKAVLTGLHH
ncbi:hypothetical protein [Acetobacter persici]|uniref:hypothetical protein n=1 Tax=Acetobacter persici TaxID=1076596 RepID=UPI0012FDE186|nr:hypothetical protein [Acetobacter persici]